MRGGERAMSLSAVTLRRVDPSLGGRIELVLVAGVVGEAALRVTMREPGWMAISNTSQALRAHSPSMPRKGAISAQSSDINMSLGSSTDQGISTWPWW